MDIINDIVYLLACALNNKQADPKKVEKMDMDKIFNICQNSSISPIIYPCIENISNTKEWKQAFAQNVRRIILFKSERDKLYQFMKENNIWYTPLKGIVLQKYYPKLGMRTMSDNDILFDKNKEKILDNYMKEQGYDSKYNELHNAYTKKPVYNFEMHKNLFLKSEKKVFAEFFNNLKELNDENYYLYQTCHHYHHDDVAGSGIRPLIDMYVYLKNKNLNSKYITSKLKDLGIEEFEKNNKIFVYKLFDNPDNIALSQNDLDKLKTLFSVSSYGSTQGLVDKKLDKFKKDPKALLKYLFPSREYMQEKGMYHAKHLILMPIYWIQLHIKRFKAVGLKNTINAIKKHK